MTNSLICLFEDENKNSVKWCYPPRFAKNLTLDVVVCSSWAPHWLRPAGHIMWPLPGRVARSVRQHLFKCGCCHGGMWLWAPGLLSVYCTRVSDYVNKQPFGWHLHRPKSETVNFQVQYLVQFYKQNLKILTKPFTGFLWMGWWWSLILMFYG